MICILYSDAKRKYFPTYEQYVTEAEVIHRAKLVEKYIKKMGYKTSLYGGNEELPKNLKKVKPRMVMNLVDSVRGQESLCPVIPATLELLNIPYTGSGQMGLAINANKFFTKTLLEEHRIRVPRFQLFSSSRDRLDKRMRFPLIVKLNEIHGSVEITQDSIVDNEIKLRKRISHLIRIYKQPILVEEFIVGREFTALIVDGVHKKIYCGERVFIDGTGKKVDCKNLVIIATSNAASDLLFQNPNLSQNDLINHLVSQNIYSPEFLNRFDGIILYEPLSKEAILQIARKTVDEISSSIYKIHKIYLKVSPEYLTALSKKGYDPKFGARNMERVVRTEIEDKLAKLILENKIKENDIINL